MPDSLRDDIMAAMSPSDNNDQAGSTNSGVQDTGAFTQDEQSKELNTGTTSVPEVGTPGEEHPSGDGRVRDALGRFARKESEVTSTSPAPKAGPDGKTPLDPAARVAADKAAADKVKADKNAATALRAPQSLSAAEREHWQNTPRPVQEAILRREGQVNQVLQNSAGARQFTEMMTQVVNPYLPMIQSTGANPFEFINGMLQAASVLRTGTAQDKAGFIAHLVKQHAVDIQMLDGALAGVQPQGGAQQQPGGVDPALIQRMVEQQLQPVRNLFGQIEQTRNANMQAIHEQTLGEMQNFAQDAKNEFFYDVKDVMADLIEAAGKRGQDMSFAQAYEIACRMHPEIAGVFQSRQAADIARKQHESAQRARNASSGIRGNPGGGQHVTAPASDSLRDAIIASINQHTGG